MSTGMSGGSSKRIPVSPTPIPLTGRLKPRITSYNVCYTKLLRAMASGTVLTNDGILLMLNGQAVGNAGDYSWVTPVDMLVNGNEELVGIAAGSVDVQSPTNLGGDENYELAIHPLYPNPASDKVSYNFV